MRHIRPRVGAELWVSSSAPCAATSAAWLVTRKGVGEQGGAGERFSIERNTAANIAGDRNSDLGLVENAI